MSESALKHILWSSSLVLPDSVVAEDDQWEGSMEAELPSRQLQILHEMTFLGTEQSEGRPLELVGSLT